MRESREWASRRGPTEGALAKRRDSRLPAAGNAEHGDHRAPAPCLAVGPDYRGDGDHRQRRGTRPPGPVRHFAQAVLGRRTPHRSRARDRGIRARRSRLAELLSTVEAARALVGEPYVIFQPSRRGWANAPTCQLTLKIFPLRQSSRVSVRNEFRGAGPRYWPASFL